MATIRIPESAESLLPYCRTSGTSGPHLWETFADMISFLASFAFGRGETPVPKPRPMKTGNPIDLAVFRSRGLHVVLLTIAIADRKDWLVAKEPDEIAAIAERYADAGAKLLSHETDSVNVEELGRRLVAELQNTPGGTPAPTI